MHKLSEINFKTTSDGWRGILGLDFTYANVASVANAIAVYAKDKLPGEGIVVGFDTRFMSESYAKLVASCIQHVGVKSYISDFYTPTPALSFSANSNNFKCGINITASHNPPEYNGIKLRFNNGSVPLAKQLKELESLISEQSEATPQVIQNLEKINIIEPYVKRIRQLVEPVPNGKVAVLVDTMHGTTNNLLSRTFSSDKNISVSYINNSIDPYFGCIPPEPKSDTTATLQQLVKNQKYNFGIAHDGDGDRIVAATGKVGYISPHSLSAMLLFYLVNYKKLSGSVLGSATLGRQLKRVSEYFGLSYEEFPVGFKNAVPALTEKKAILVAEENGGIGFGFYLPERDATLAAALLVEAEMSVKNGLNGLLEQIERIAGKSGFCRRNYTPKSNRETLLAMFEREVAQGQFGKYQKNRSPKNGVRLVFENEDWAIVRISGTENILRIYAESDSAVKASSIAVRIAEKLNSLEKNG